MDVSVVVPAFNGEALIAETIRSILAQTHKPREIIVVDDGSTDGTRDILAAFGDKITWLGVVNSGVQVARNLAISNAGSNWIAFCDQDDLWQSGYLAAQARLLLAAPEIDFSFSNFRIMRNGTLESNTKFDESPTGYWEALPHRILPEGWVFDVSIASATYRFHPIFPSATMVSKRLLHKIGGFDPAMRGLRNEDGEMVLRCLYRATVGVLPDPLVIIRRHGANYSRDLVSRLLDEIVTMKFIRQHHAEAAAYHAIITDEIERRYVEVIEAAFAARDHARIREIFRHVPRDRRSPRLWAKRIVASLPTPVAVRLNVALQQYIGGRIAEETSFTR